MIGNKNCVTYKEVFPLIKENKLWSGRTEWSGGMWFETKNQDDVDKVINGLSMKNVSSMWLTNIGHGRRHQTLPLMTMEDNLKYSKHKEIKGKSYQKYHNYNALEVPFTDAIPSDYAGALGVPISFLDKYSPDQFEIIGISLELGERMSKVAKKGTYVQGGPRFYLSNVDGTYRRMYDRIVIKKRTK